MIYATGNRKHRNPMAARQIEEYGRLKLLHLAEEIDKLVSHGYDVNSINLYNRSCNNKWFYAAHGSPPTMGICIPPVVDRLSIMYRY